MGVLRIFLCGDVMTGRGVDQIMPRPCESTLHESYVQSALDYVQLAEALNGAIPRPVEPSYIWGQALAELGRSKPNLRIINLETTITRSDDYLDKGINYRMSPENAKCLAAAGVDCCVLANNHMLDWGPSGLADTVTALQRLKIKSVGAGRNHAEAEAPAVLSVAGKGRVLGFPLRFQAAGPRAAGVPRPMRRG